MADMGCDYHKTNFHLETKKIFLSLLYQFFIEGQKNNILLA